MSVKNIVLIGLPGCGKSTIGAKLSQKLKLPFFDIDECIEQREKKKIKDIFLEGENAFREVESKVLREILEKEERKVISTGGGVVKLPENMELLKADSIIVFINRPIENIAKDINTEVRPLLAGNLSRIYTIYEERMPLYRKYCDHEILNDGTIKQVLEEIVAIIKGVLQ